MSRKDKTMISASVVQAEAFTSLPKSAQALWLQLNPEADHYGILANAKRVMRASGFEADENGGYPDLQSLIDGGFVLPLQPAGTLYAIADWWAMNQFAAKHCRTDYGEEITEQLCIIEGSKRYSLQAEAAETMRPTGCAAYEIVPIYAPAGGNNPSTDQVQYKYSTSIYQSKVNQSKGNATESQGQEQGISKQTLKSKATDTAPGIAMDACPNCHEQVAVSDYGTMRAFDCLSCGLIQVDTTTGERV